MPKDYNIKQIRNFSIIAHIDHGKSTLADRFLELTNTVEKRRMHERFLDMMPLEQEKGVTIKMQPVKMEYSFGGNDYALNLIDTPGHVDFTYEVSRSMAAVEGTILLVEAVKGIQAQTLHNLSLAKKQGLVIVPAVNKIDMPNARTEQVCKELADILGISPEEILKISARQGTNVKELLEKIIRLAPCPEGNEGKPLKALIFDSIYDPYKGVVAFCRIVDGKVARGDRIFFKAGAIESIVKEVGFFRPELAAAENLQAGDIGYIATGVKELDKVRVGDTVTKVDTADIEPLPGYRSPKPVVFASLYPENADEFDSLKIALEKLKLTDPSFTFEVESEKILGRGFRCGFLGSFHAEIVLERIKRDFGLNLILSSPTVVYKIIDNNGRDKLVYSPADWDNETIAEAQEPWCLLEVMTPPQFLGQVLEVLQTLRSQNLETKHLSQDNVLLVYEAPLAEVISGFYDDLKGQTKGYGSMNYEIVGYKKSALTKLDILIAGKKVDALSKIVPEEFAFKQGKAMVKKLKEIFPGQQFSVALQAVVSGKVIARETIKAKGKDVTAPLYGGDYTRKSKLLKQQKKGKKKLKERGQLHVPPKVFLEMFKSR